MKKLFYNISDFFDPKSSVNIDRTISNFKDELKTYSIDFSLLDTIMEDIFKEQNPEIKHQLKLDYLEKLKILGKDIWLEKLDKRAW